MMTRVKFFLSALLSAVLVTVGLSALPASAADGASWGRSTVGQASGDSLWQQALAVNSSGLFVSVSVLNTFEGLTAATEVQTTYSSDGVNWAPLSVIEVDSPTGIPEGATASTTPSIAVSPQGRFVAVWSVKSESGWQVKSITSTDGKNWSSVTTLPASVGNVGQAPAVAVDSNGNFVTVWTVYSESLPPLGSPPGTNLQTGGEVYASSSSDGSTWSSATLISGNSATNASAPSIAYSNGTFVAAWLYASTSTTYDVQARSATISNGSVSWGQTQTVQTGGNLTAWNRAYKDGQNIDTAYELGQGPSIVADSDGTFALAWILVTDPQTSALEWSQQVATSQGGNSWSAVTSLTSPVSTYLSMSDQDRAAARSPQLVATSSGSFLAGWNIIHGDQDDKQSTFVTSTWSGAAGSGWTAGVAAPDTVPGYNLNPMLAATPQNEFAATFAVPGALTVSDSANGSSWSAPQSIGAGGNQQSPIVGMTGGRFVLLTQGYVTPGDSTSGSVFYSYATETTVTFEGNGAEGSMPAQSSVFAQPLAPNNYFTKAGYRFTGWNTQANNGGVAYANEATYNFLADMTLYAQWEAIPGYKFTVQFDSNAAYQDPSQGGYEVVSGTMLPQQSRLDAHLDANTFTASSYGVSGWNTEPDGSGTSYALEGLFPFTQGNAVLYAQWANMQLVAFHGHGGSGEMPFQQGFSSTPLDANVYTNGTNTFVGWNSQADGNGAVSLKNKEAYNFLVGIDLYAQWSSTQKAVSFEANGGYGNMPDQVANNNTSTALDSNTFTRQGYTFTGWDTQADGTGTDYADGANYPFATSATLYAQWQLATSTDLVVGFDGNGGSGTMAPQVAGSLSALSRELITNHGYNFTTWAAHADGSGLTFQDGDDFDFTSSTNFAAAIPADPNMLTLNAATGNGTLYAQWALNDYAVTFNPNGGSGTMEEHVSSSPTQLHSVAFTRPGYDFAGWNTAHDGSGTAYADGEVYAFDVPDTLFAQWTPKLAVTGVSSDGAYALAGALGVILAGLAIVISHRRVSLP